MKNRLIVGSLVLVVLAGGCQNPEAEPPARESASSSVSEQQATLMLGVEAKQVVFPYLKQRGITVFHAGSAYYAFTDDEHICIASHWGGFMGESKVMDFNNDGRDDLIIHHEWGSGLVRPHTTAVMDDGKCLRVFSIYGTPIEHDGEWKVPHPLACYGLAKDKSTPVLRFDPKAIITVEWPQGTPEERKWSKGEPEAVVQEVKWRSNQPVPSDGS